MVGIDWVLDCGSLPWHSGVQAESDVRSWKADEDGISDVATLPK